LGLRSGHGYFWFRYADRYVERLPAHERCVERTERAPSEEEKHRRRPSALLRHLSPSIPIGHGRGVEGVGLGNRDFSFRAVLRGYDLCILIRGLLGMEQVQLTLGGGTDVGSGLQRSIPPLSPVDRQIMMLFL